MPEYKERYIGENKKVKLSRDIFLLAVLSVAITIIGLSMSEPGVKGLFEAWEKQPVLIVLNLWPVMLIALFFMFLFGNAYKASIATSAIVFPLNYINLLKIEGRDDVLIAQDISLIREAFQAAREYEMDMHIGLIAIAAMFTGFLFIKAADDGRDKIKNKAKVIGVIASAVLTIGSIKTVYADTDLYTSLKKDDAYHLSRVYEQLGFNYSFLYYSTRINLEAGSEYSKKEVEEYIREYSNKGYDDSFNPNIIVIMCEAFSDFCDEDVFEYTEEESPIKAYHDVANDNNSISGHIVVTNYGAGTTNTEFDVMTGMQAGELGATSVFREVRSDTDNIYSVLKKQGYDGYFMHPGEDWFYNRKNVYRYFGINDQVFDEAFTEDDYSGFMISDNAFVDRLLNDMQSRIVDNEKPLFAYATTIENHAAYPGNKYGDAVEDIQIKPNVSNSTREELVTYFTGLKHGAESLKRITDYFDEVDEPTIIVFFGDHRGNLNTSYEELGYKDRIDSDDAEDILWSYAAPYVIHVNQAFVKEKDFQKAKTELDLPKSGIISDNYIPGIILELCGKENNAPWFSFLSELRREYPVMRGWQGLYIDKAGNQITEPTAGSEVLLHKFRNWEWYILKDS